MTRKAARASSFSFVSATAGAHEARSTPPDQMQSPSYEPQRRFEPNTALSGRCNPSAEINSSHCTSRAQQAHCFRAHALVLKHPLCCSSPSSPLTLWHTGQGAAALGLGSYTCLALLAVSASAELCPPSAKWEMTAHDTSWSEFPRW